VSKNPYLTLASKLEQSLFGKISTDPDQYMLANPVTYGISVLEFSLVTVLPDPDLPKIKYPNKSKQMYWLIWVFLVCLLFLYTFLA
jgi:hypothetical protein